MFFTHYHRSQSVLQNRLQQSFGLGAGSPSGKLKLYGLVARFRKFKSCQNHLQLHLWLPNYVVLTVRTEKSPKICATSYARGVPKKAILQCKNERKMAPLSHLLCFIFMLSLTTFVLAGIFKSMARN